MKRTMLGLLLLSSLAIGQSGQPVPSATTRIVTLQSVRAEQLGGIADIYGVRTAAVPGTNSIAARGTPEGLDAFEKALRQLDKPVTRRRNVEMTFYLLGAGSQVENEVKLPDLEPVVKQLRAAFPYPHYELLDTAYGRARETTGYSSGGVALKGMGDTSGGGTNYVLQIKAVDVSGENAATSIHLDGVKLSINFWLKLPNGGTSTHGVALQADIDVKPNQKVVVGKMTGEKADGSEKPVFLVVSARVVD